MRLTSIRRPVRRGIKDEKGQAAIELLLVFPVFIVIVLLAVDFGLWMYQSVSVASAVRDGARYAAVNCGGAPRARQTTSQRTRQITPAAASTPLMFT